MSLVQKKILLGGVSVLAVGGAGAWMWMKGFWGNGEVKEPSNVTLLRKPNNRTQTTNVKKQESTLETGTEIIQPAEPEVKETLDPPEETKLPQEEERGVVTEESVVIYDPKKQIGEVGLDCGDAEREMDCRILEGGLNVDIDGDKRDNYEIIDGENGKIKFRISDDPIFNDKFRFIVTGKPIQLRSKTDTTQTLTLERYENYGVERVEDKVYLKRKLNVEQGKKRSLGLPDKCALPTEVSTIARLTCKLTREQIRSVNFEEKKNGGATSGGEVDLYIQKVNDTKTYGGGYKFTFHPKVEVEINKDDKIKGNVKKDFRLKDSDADDLVLERVWKEEGGLLSQVGLTCGADGKCSINDGALKIKDGKGIVTIENGKKKDGNGIIHLENKNAAGYYEGLMFSVWGGEITIESATSPGSIFKMEELGIYHIVKEEKGGTTSYYLTRKKGGVDEMITNYLGVWSCPPREGNIRTCQGRESNISWYRFHDGEGERKIKVNEGDPGITIVINPYQKSYPFGYKYTFKPKKDIQVGKMTLNANVENNFKIKKDVVNKKLYLEKVK